MDLQMYGALRDLFDSIDSSGHVSLPAWQSAKATLEQFEHDLDAWTNEMENSV